MPTYIYQCDDENQGCGHAWELKCLMSELEDKKPKSCPNCRKRKSVIRAYGDVTVTTQVTLGSLAEKNTRNMSEDEKQHRHVENNKYKDAPPAWESTNEGIKRIKR